MLADFPIDSAQSGTFSKDLHWPVNFLLELLDFIADELPRWRDDPERPIAESETTLTEHLCDFLGGAARRSSGWDVLQFRTEVTDEENKGTKDRPRTEAIWNNDLDRWTPSHPVRLAPPH